MSFRIGHFHVITNTSRHGHVQLAQLAIAGGADTIQLRAKHVEAGALTRVARELKEVCAAAGVPLIINDSVEVALAVDAAGVHLGPDDVPVKHARAALGPDKIVGASAGSPAAAKLAAMHGASYIGCGHVFPTRSKPKTTPPIGLDALHAVCNAVSIPVVAIGGITVDLVPVIMAAGAWGAAVISAVCSSDDPRAAAQALSEAISP